MKYCSKWLCESASAAIALVIISVLSATMIASNDVGKQLLFRVISASDAHSTFSPGPKDLCLARAYEHIMMFWTFIISIYNSIYNLMI